MTLAQLLANIQFWTKRSDLAPYLTGFIELTEARINRALRVRQMEAPLGVVTIADGEAALPADCLAVRSAWPSGRPEWAIEDAALEEVLQTPRGAAHPSLMSLGDGVLYVNGSGDIEGVYYKRLPALTNANPSNWVSLQHGDLYLFGCLSEAFTFAHNTQQAALWGARFEAMLQEVAGTDKRDRHAGRLTARKG